MITDTLTFDNDPVPPPVRFTYTHPDQSLFRRSLIRTVEIISGQPRLQRLYRDRAAVAGELSRRVSFLTPKTTQNSDEVFNWPSRITW